MRISKEEISVFMTKKQVRQAILEFIDFFEKRQNLRESDAEHLSLVLDRIALASHFSECTFDTKNYPDPPENETKNFRDLIEKKFPTYGYYNIPEKIVNEIADSKILVGDAIDDICDILKDMRDIAWRWENNSEEDALWHFNFGYSSHWGEHLRCLQLYIYMAKYE